MKNQITWASLLALHFGLVSCAAESHSLLQVDLIVDSEEGVDDLSLGRAESSSWRANVDWEISRFTWGIDSGFAKATLVPWEGRLRVKVSRDDGTDEIDIPLGLLDGAKLHPISLGLLSPTALVVGANIVGTSSGKILLIDLENKVPGQPYSVSTLYSGSSFAWPSSIFVNPDKPNTVFVFDEASHRALSFERGSGDFSVVGDPTATPSLLECRFIQAGASVYSNPETGEVINSWTVRCSPTKSADPFYTQNTYLIDISNDSITDFVELSR